MSTVEVPKKKRTPMGIVLVAGGSAGLAEALVCRKFIHWFSLLLLSCRGLVTLTVESTCWDELISHERIYFILFTDSDLFTPILFTRLDPLDTIKVRMQLSRSSRGKGVS